jgi:hypothetical protein
MSLDESKVKDLEELGFDKFFDKHKKDWLSDAKDAYDYAKKHITKGKEPREDDVLKGLIPMLEVDERLRKFQATTRGAGYKKFRTIFGEYIVDHYLRTLPKEEKK